MVDDAGESADLGEHRHGAVGLHFRVLGADLPAGRSRRAATRATVRSASRPSAPEKSASAGSWVRTSTATCSQYSNGM